MSGWYRFFRCPRCGEGRVQIVAREVAQAIATCSSSSTVMPYLFACSRCGCCAPLLDWREESAGEPDAEDEAA